MDELRPRSPLGYGVLLIVLAAALELAQLLRPMPRNAFAEGQAIGGSIMAGFIFVVGAGLAVYHFLVYQKYQDDDPDRRE